MRQRCWVELIKDYDCVIEYHSGKANVVADALSRKNKMIDVDLDDNDERELLELRKINAKVEVGPRGSLIAQLRVRSILQDKVLEAQQNDDRASKIRDNLKSGVGTSFQILEDGMIAFGKRMYLPDDETLKREVLQKAHESRFATHPESTKLYQDLKECYWWPDMKKDVAEYVAKCGVCQQVKVEHQKPAGPLQPLLIPQWKWEDISMDFVSGLPKKKRGNNVIWVIVDRLTKSAIFLPMRTTYSVDKLAKLHVNEVIKLHEVPVSIVSYRDLKFTFRLWPSIQRALGTRLNLSTTFHPQTDRQIERTIQNLEYLLRACILEFRGN
jgi:hypothetical protein